MKDSIAYYREINHVKKTELTNRANFTAVLAEEIATATQAFTKHHPDQSVAINIKAR